MTKKQDKKVATEPVELIDEQLDEVSGGLVNVLENPNQGLLDSARTDKSATQDNDTVIKNTNLCS